MNNPEQPMLAANSHGEQVYRQENFRRFVKFFLQRSNRPKMFYEKDA